MKRSAFPELAEVQAVKRQEKHIENAAPATLMRPVSPPTIARKASKPGPRLSAVEAGELTVDDHFALFSSKLLEASRTVLPGTSRISHAAWCELYQHNLNPQGRHFVIHQHDHPVAGTHYDLRLQCNGTSSISFAIMYGLPGDPNSRRLSRNATETRVHNLWNHLIETASHSTGSMLIWDTGEYSILPYRESKQAPKSSSEESDHSGPINSQHGLSESQKLHDAFQQGRIRIRLHGTRLPHNYTVSLRLSKDDYRSEQPGPPWWQRKKLSPGPARRETQQTSSSESESDPSTSSSAPFTVLNKDQLTSFRRTASPSLKNHHTTAGHISPSDHSSTSRKRPTKPTFLHTNHPSEPNSVNKVSNITGAHSENENENKDEDEDELETTRLTNTYPGGATNTISSIHQRRWFLTLDRHNSGFVHQLNKATGHKRWVRRWSVDDDTRDGFERFHVLGREVERSVVTGRLARDILRDEGVEGFVPRGGWRGVVE
ncbi:hypothetical protein GJ744_007876 [Endocarpon pusillum]|uniref:DNA ligase D 3'-phosphoesterase domain-containing protein n=1 Tax=Endocarpon pusillum TaxID=364733 RepID=A0A8H7AQW6_9EURO|nr:hypothetical protein GJ744_007876 [Endocarpon pusillum]